MEFRGASGSRPRLRGLGVVLVATGVVSCALPSSTLGTYDVRGVLVTDTCDMGPNPWTFEVMLSRDGSTLYWNWLDASPMLSGPVGADGHVDLSGYQLHNVDSTASGMGPCDLQRNDDLTVALAKGTPPGSFTGTITYSFAAQIGSDCSDQLGSAGGMYARLPCSITYTLTGTIH